MSVLLRVIGWGLMALAILKFVSLIILLIIGHDRAAMFFVKQVAYGVTFLLIGRSMTQIKD